MNLDAVRQFCLSLPHATEVLQWEDFLLMKVGGKMFAILALEPTESVCSLRTTPERYFELVEMVGINPASHNMWKYQWVSMEHYDVLSDTEWLELLRGSYDIIRASLPKKIQATLGDVAEAPKRIVARKSARAAVTSSAGKRAKVAKTVRQSKGKRDAKAHRNGPPAR
jgi:predicted DNA-binding protein (MmcQ/YjbR family)